MTSQSRRLPHVIIAGAGIGGLAAALALLRAGCDVTVCEQAPTLGEIGAGLQVAANGTRVLSALGLDDDMARLAWQPEGKVIRLWNTGETWSLFDLGAESVARYGFPYLMFHRADLHGALAAAVRALKPDAIRTGARATGFEEGEDEVRLLLGDGSSVTGDVLVGADGIHSAIRDQQIGPDKATFTGLVAWRGTVATERLPAHLRKPVGTNWIGAGGHVVHYFLRGGALFNFVGVREREDWQVESWTERGSAKECHDDFAGWHEDIHAMIDAIGDLHKWALMAREPLPRWSSRRVTLLGDACHATLPFLAQGAVMALEDGLILARAISEAGGEIPGALRRYEAARIDRTARVVRGSSENTIRFHSPELAERDSAAAYVAEQFRPDRVRERYDWLFTYDATTAPL